MVVHICNPTIWEAEAGGLRVSSSDNSVRSSKQKISRVGEMSQWVKALAATPDDLSSELRTHMVREENRLPGAFL